MFFSSFLALTRRIPLSKHTGQTKNELIFRYREATQKGRSRAAEILLLVIEIHYENQIGIAEYELFYLS